MTTSNEYTFDQIQIGQSDEFFHDVTENDITAFSNLTGDSNPLHMDSEYSATTNLEERVVHGMLTASFISTMIGTRIPGKGSLWYEQHIKYLVPVRIGDRIRVWAKVKHKSLSQQIVVLETVIYNQHNEKVIDGEAKVKVVSPIKLETQPMNITQVPITDIKGGVIISGASKGIGAAAALKLAQLGYGVMVNYHKSKSDAQKVVDEIINSGGRAACIQADVRDKDAVDAMVSAALKEFGSIAGIVNNASAPIEYLSFSEISWNDFQTHLDIQIQGSLNLCKAAMPHLIEQNKGSIVNITSIYADNVPPIKMMHYSLSKAALASFTKSLAAEMGPKGIRVNAISPGMTATDMIADTPEKAKMVTKMMTPMRRLGQPDDVAASIAFLIGDDSMFITGETLRVCGGQIML